ncbi:hypothetical protein KIK84_01690 [Curvibacter sp. CHRR-16]|uniref:hypothetical protein n=1 Tax=Curvibacter sp. CHRR-16 TaxID=2835872 RepID=UPI001BDA5776|nr:hypothetical protein [Curvibacter sp. CHRR-16]MBT0569028.1 hypothetical protein [Curvibacter sp. CHRR-16]
MSTGTQPSKPVHPRRWGLAGPAGKALACAIGMAVSLWASGAEAYEPATPYALQPDSPRSLESSVGWYAGIYHDAEPAGAIAGRANYQDQYMLALTGTTTLWKSDTWPVSIELDGMLGQQWGLANVTEFSVAPALRWGGLPWRDVLRTDVRLAPLGYSYTSEVGPLERGPEGQGSRTLNFLFVEVAFSRPQTPQNEWFVRLHHRCAIYDLLNNYGANGEDFLTFGFRKRF